MKMLTCTQPSLCSRDYIVEDESGKIGAVEFLWLFEDGSIQCEERTYRVVKHGLFSGRWTLEYGGELIAEGKKPRIGFRKYVVRFGTEEIILKPESIFTRPFKIIAGEKVIGRITPNHPLTREATIRCSDSISNLIQLFCLWLAAISWKRYSKS